MSTVGGPKILQSGIVSCLDIGDRNCYSGSGSSMQDTVLNATWVDSTSGPNPSWANDISNITICVLLQKTGVLTGYASHPVNKWNGGTGNASFVLYQFGNYNNNGADGVFGWYFTRESAGWGGISVTTLAVGQFAHMSFEYNTSTGASVYLNGNIVGTAAAAGRLGVGGASNIIVHGPGDNGHTKVHHISMYNRSLSAREIKSNYNVLKSRWSLT